MILIFALAAAASLSASDGVWRIPAVPKLVADTVIALPVEENHGIAKMEMRVNQKNSNSSNFDRQCSGFRWHTDSARTVEVSIAHMPSSDYIYIENYALLFRICVTDSAGNVRTVVSKKIGSDVITDCNSNSMRVILNNRGRIEVLLGASYLSSVYNAPVDFAKFHDAEFFVKGRGKLDWLSYEWTNDRNKLLSTGWTADSLLCYMKSPERHRLEGFWKYLDRSTDDNYATIGGKYVLASVLQPDGSLLLLYYSGARVERDAWMPGMIKARLKPTIFKDHFDLEWWDAVKQLRDDENFAQFGDEGILTISIPLLHATLRFSKMPLDN